MVYYRRLPKFEYLSPRTVEEAMTVLKEKDGKARIIAGGTDILVQMKCRTLTPDYLIGIKQIKGLDYIKYSDHDGLRFGGGCTIASIENSPIIWDKFNALYQAVKSMASAQIRNAATVAGNICSAVPSADTAPALIVHGAKLTLRSLSSERTIDIEKFFAGPRETVLNTGELLTEIHIPKINPESKGVYLKYGLRRSMSLATVGVAVLVTQEKGFCKDIRIALGAVAPVPIRAEGAEAVLQGQLLNDKLIENAARIALEEARPISDMRASSGYRSELIRVLTKRAIKQACGKLK